MRSAISWMLVSMRACLVVSSSAAAPGMGLVDRRYTIFLLLVDFMSIG
jgi:hypothetical protein